jgi:subtilisin family serine protease
MFVRFRGLLLLHVLIVVGLILSDVAAIPLDAMSKESRPAAEAEARAREDSAPAGKRAKRKQDRRQDQRKDRKEGRKKEHTQADRKKDRKPDRKKERQKNRGQVQELTTGRLPAAESVSSPEDRVSVEDRYIVLLADAAASAERTAASVAASTAGVVPTHVYEHVFDGFAAVIPDDQVDDVRNDPRVQAVVPDELVHLEAQTLPTGIDRIDADDNPTADIDGVDERVDVDVAVLDTGIDSHPDLNIWASANCTDSPDPTDDDGHGTHVAGTIGALDNGTGVVGVAPGARLWSIKVLKGGTGTRAWILCGVDLVRKYATNQGDGFGDVEVANASLSGDGSDSNCQTNLSDAYHQGYCRAVAAGVTFVVAAGNQSVNASTRVPAAYDEVITVSALADSDGRPGGLGPATGAGADESFADFSNFGTDVDIAAPGVSILSTVPGGGYQKLQGTSMAAPHVAGAAALYLAKNPGKTPGQVQAELQFTRENHAMPGDPDGWDEGVLKVGNETAPPPPPTDTQAPTVQWLQPVGVNQQYTVSAGTIQFEASASDNVGVDVVEFWFRDPQRGWLLFRLDGVAPYTASWDVADLNVGVTEFSADAYDAAGNWSTKSIFVNRAAAPTVSPPPPPPDPGPPPKHKKKKSKKKGKKKKR